MRLNKRNLLFVAAVCTIVVGGLIGCRPSENSVVEQVEAVADVPINLDHFDFLYAEVVPDEDTLGIVHIYSEYPDYSYAIEPSEGYTCVDDVARAVVMLSHYYQSVDASPKVLRKIRNMVQFILHMQNQNGYFNNFLWNDLTINTTYKTSVAESNWWSFRALWALETAIPLFENEGQLAQLIRITCDRYVTNLIQTHHGVDHNYDTIATLRLPMWLPDQYAADRAAIAVLGLLPYYQRTNKEEVKFMIISFGDGMMAMQKGDATRFPHYAFLSWQNIWHAWGNSQAFALLKIAEAFQVDRFRRAALNEIEYFYPYLLNKGFAEYFKIERSEAGWREIDRKTFPQIAYGLRPMIWAASEAYRQTKDAKYLQLANELSTWFFKNNIASALMYDEKTGRGYDGIIGQSEVNRNSGAESTIESLLALMRLNEVNK